MHPRPQGLKGARPPLEAEFSTNHHPQPPTPRHLRSGIAPPLCCFQLRPWAETEPPRRGGTLDSRILAHLPRIFSLLERKGAWRLGLWAASTDSMALRLFHAPLNHPQLVLLQPLGLALRLP